MRSFGEAKTRAIQLTLKMERVLVRLHLPKKWT